MSVAKTSAKGQVVIRAEIRRRAGLHSGDRVSVQEEDGIIIITPVVKDPIKSLRGILKGQPSRLPSVLVQASSPAIGSSSALVVSCRSSGFLRRLSFSSH